MYCQQFLKSWLERDLIDEELVLAGYKEGDAVINYMTNNPNLDNKYLDDADDDTTVIDDNSGDDNGESNTIDE